MDWDSSSAGSVLVTQVLDRWVLFDAFVREKVQTDEEWRTFVVKTESCCHRSCWNVLFLHRENQYRHSLTAQLTRCYSHWSLIGPHSRTEFFFCGTNERLWSSVRFTFLTLNFWIKWLVKRSKVKIFNNRYAKLKDSDWGLKTSRQSHYCVLLYFEDVWYFRLPSDGLWRSDPNNWSVAWNEALQSQLLFCGGIRTLLTDFSASDGSVTWQKCSVLALYSLNVQAEWLDRTEQHSQTLPGSLHMNSWLMQQKNHSEETRYRSHQPSVIQHDCQVVVFTLMTTVREHSLRSVFSTLHRIQPPVM